MKLLRGHCYNAQKAKTKKNTRLSRAKHSKARSEHVRPTQTISTATTVLYSNIWKDLCRGQTEEVF